MSDGISRSVWLVFLPATVDPPRVLGAAGYFDCVGGLPVPRQQRVQFVRLGCSRHDVFQHVGQPGQRIDIVQLGRLDRNCSPRVTTRTLGNGKVR